MVAAHFDAAAVARTLVAEELLPVANQNCQDRVRLSDLEKHRMKRKISITCDVSSSV